AVDGDVAAQGDGGDVHVQRPAEHGDALAEARAVVARHVDRGAAVRDPRIVDIVRARHDELGRVHRVAGLAERDRVAVGRVAEVDGPGGRGGLLAIDGDVAVERDRRDIYVQLAALDLLGALGSGARGAVSAAVAGTVVPGVGARGGGE